MPAVIRPPSPWGEEMYEAVGALTSRVGLSIMRELSVHGPADVTELMAALHVLRRQTLLRTLNRLEAAGIVAGDLVPEERMFRPTRYSLNVDQVKAYFAQLQGFALGAEIDTPLSAPGDTED